MLYDGKIEVPKRYDVKLELRVFMLTRKLCFYDVLCLRSNRSTETCFYKKKKKYNFVVCCSDD